MTLGLSIQWHNSYEATEAEAATSGPQAAGLKLSKVQHSTKHMMNHTGDRFLRVNQQHQSTEGPKN